MILRNSAVCNHCKDEIESKHRHDFIKCSCGKVAVDGGKDYKRTMFTKLSDFTDTSIEDNGTHELRRKILSWGKNYDENMNRLPETEWVTIENMTSDHIQAILDGLWVENNPFYKELFEEELKFRVGGSV